MNLKQEAEKIMEQTGKVRGVVFYTHSSYIVKREGQKGLELVENKMQEIGYPVKFNEIKSFDWYSEAHSALVVLTAKEVFNWSEDDIFDMGNNSPKYSLIINLLMKYFLSARKTFESAPKYWEKYYDFGYLKVVDFSEDKKIVVIRTIGYKTHPLICIFHKGFFMRVAQYVIKSEKLTIEETKCVFKGDDYNEYKIKWQ